MDSQQQLDVVAGLQNGDPWAWRALFNEFAPRLWQFVGRRIGHQNQTEIGDIVQETMMSAARSASSFDSDRGTLWYWVRGIAGNQLALHFRKQNQQDILARAEKEILQSDGQLGRWLNCDDDLPSRQLMNLETAEQVRWALAQIPIDYSDLLTSKYLDDKSIKEIADDDGTTVAAIHSKLARARKAFRGVFTIMDVKSKP